MNKYNHKEIESKWQEIWDRDNAFATENNFKKPKYYALVEFPYPSGQGLHVGHPRSYTALDIVARKRRMQGYNVLYPMGWDAFGLPTENFAIKNKIHPKIVTKQNVEKFKKQLKSLGLSFDWNREIDTTDPQYYKWTQWIFLQLFKKGLAYKSKSAVNWCTSCKCVLANEEVIQGKCERCSHEVVHKIKSQWMLGITKYAQRLIDDLDLVDYTERVRAQQKHWIGRSEGAEINFETSTGESLKVFTTRPDTLFGVTYMVISPEHPLLSKWNTEIQNIKEIENYQIAANKKSDFERTKLSKNKTGVKIEGVIAVHPVTGQDIPIFVSDYVMMSYGTGAIMAVPAHDERDLEFAQKYDLPIFEVIKNGKIINSDFISGLTCEDAKKEIIKWLKINNKGKSKINYKLRDWIFSRQRYWGEPIPIVCCDKCGFIPIPEEELPLELPDVGSFETTDDGESPLSKITDWVNTKCPKCGQLAKRETDTMPQWAGSSWYFLRYLDPKNNTTLASKEAINYWLPVDWYNGGMEHTTLHLLYSRFWHKFLYDIGVVPMPEPYAKRTSHGMILGENGEKMSKSKGNVVNPDEIIEKYGADTLRLYEMFIGDFEKAAPWSDSSIRGCRRFLERYWGLQKILDNSKPNNPKLDISINKTIKKVGEDIENLKFNTAIAALMALLNEFYDAGSINNYEFKIFTVLLNLFAPHITEEIWKNHTLGEGLVAKQIWPKYDATKCMDKEIEIAVQVNGKVKSKLIITPEMSKDKVFALAQKDESISKIIDGKETKKLIYVPQKLLNIVV